MGVHGIRAHAARRNKKSKRPKKPRFHVRNENSRRGAGRKGKGGKAALNRPPPRGRLKGDRGKG